MQVDRRAFLKFAAAAGAGAAFPRELFGDPATKPAAIAPRRVQMVRFPEKTDLILLTDRPPQLETPIRYFKSDLTPNDAFFVRWHESGIPTSVDLRTFRLSVAGHVDKPLSLSVDDLKRQFKPKEFIAVAQCSGNSRSFFQPRVAGGQWANGAVGNAKWTGVPLRDVLKRAGVKAGAVDVSFGGLDRPPLSDTPRFVKSLEYQRALDENILVAYAMNDADLPMLNGFPLRLVVPGWFATYWVKSLSEITVLNEKFKGFWMDKAYRIPKNPEAIESPQALATDTVPITKHTIRSLFVASEIKGNSIDLEGVAFDAGEGITKVEISGDDGKTWHPTQLDRDMGKFAWRRWRATWVAPSPGTFSLMCCATNAAGEMQVATPRWNRSGYQRNVIERMEVAFK